ncbi:MAG: hypothetical protein H0U69_06450, partial [Trueperaceae bacterium]|nr:hypothetical protein [Trueperaceae bacterium]
MDWLRRNWPDLAIGVALVAVIAGIVATLLTGGSFFPPSPTEVATRGDPLPPPTATAPSTPGAPLASSPGDVLALPPGGTPVPTAPTPGGALDAPVVPVAPG